MAEDPKTITDASDEDLDKLMPSMNVGLPEETEETALITDEALMGVYGEIMENIREDREQVEGILQQFAEMVINSGDSSSSSKEALVNLLKMKTDTADKMSKVADLMTRLKLKEKDTFPRYLAAKQNNTINISDGGSKKKLIQALNKAAKKAKKGDENEQ